MTRTQRSRLMSKIKSKSGIERLPPFLKGLYLRPHPRIFGNPDFGNARRKIALFIDGCFWHGCPKHYREPKSNREFWRSKIRGNGERDERVSKRLRELGFKVVRLWEHELAQGPSGRPPARPSRGTQRGGRRAPRQRPIGRRNHDGRRLSGDKRDSRP